MRTLAIGFALAVGGLAPPLQAQVVATRDRVGDTLQYVVPALAAAYVLRDRDTEGLKELAYTLGVSQGTTEVLKHVVNAKRPDGTELGFPSGHAAIVFASAGFVQRRYGTLEAIPLYALATWTAYSRVHTHHHFTRDVIGGAVIGTGSAFLMTHRLERAGGASLWFGPEGVGVSYARTW
jgi:membrane-associated phospholipid phosphatase